MQIRNFICVMLLAAGGAAHAQTEGGDEIVVVPGETIAATIEARPARLLVSSGKIDRLTLDAGYVARNGIKPAPILGRASLEVAGRREFKGRNRPLDFIIAGKAHKARAFWFADAPPLAADGQIGPWGLPQARVTFRLDAPAGIRPTSFPLFGDVDGTGFTIHREATFGMGVTFDVDSNEAYPVATAAAGAAIAAAYGGQLGGPSWDVEILLGIKRPVRLLTLARPLGIGPLSFTRIAVRVRDRIDAAGSGGRIADADDVADPSEIVVEGNKKGPRPIYGLTIARGQLTGCSRLTFDKAAKTIELLCR